MAFCNECAEQLGDDDRFCSGCGSPVESGAAGEAAIKDLDEDEDDEDEYEGFECARCAAEVEERDRFCSSCGRRLDQSLADSTDQSDEQCPNCGGRQQVTVGATQFRCATCNSDVAFALCSYCQTTNSVLPQWSAFNCFSCGRQTMLRAPGERLMRAGQALDNAGKTMNGIVGSIILIILIVFLYKACSP